MQIEQACSSALLNLPIGGVLSTILFALVNYKRCQKVSIKHKIMMHSCIQFPVDELCILQIDSVVYTH